MLMTDLKGRALVTIVGGQGDVIQSVLASVLNATSILEASYGGHEEYYFLKEFGFHSDNAELQRLSGTYNISTEAGIRNNAEAKVLCAANRASTICILYGIEKSIQRGCGHRLAKRNCSSEKRPQWPQSRMEP